jgi:hypothetical protein
MLEKMNEILNKCDRIVELVDERNYLQNLLEAEEESGLDLYTIILNKINDIEEELETLERSE